METGIRRYTNDQFLLIEGTDFTRPIYGSGNAAVVSSALRYFGEAANIVGVTSENHPLGEWTSIEIDGTEHRFLPVITSEQIRSPRTGSANLDLGIALYRNREALACAGIEKALTRTYSILWALNLTQRHWDVCFYYPGLGNPMVVGRKAKVTKYFASIYERIQAGALDRNVSVAFAAAPPSEISAYNAYLEKIGVNTRVHSLTTAVDTATFYPRSKTECRRGFDLSEESLVLGFVGRLARVKGIPLLLDSLERIKERIDRPVHLLLVGGGEAEQELKSTIQSRGLSAEVTFTGMLSRDGVAKAISASDVCVVGSLVEGFSNAMLEQLACGKPIVSTDVSGAREIIAEGKNGFVIGSRDPDEFGEAVIKAAALEGVEPYNLRLVRELYSEEAQWGRVARDWLSSK